ncbi:MAG: LysR family transcriptional regulator [Candidatus Accumulibacter sp.]|jgi:DNA-binding transcriptional LysR family regulator|nr:LysR family transcriptional regulator [Accumulibacter sp.]
MPRTSEFNNLLAFIVVARERNFTRAAAQLGVSQSALSHTMRGLEEKLGVRLLTRTTRGVTPTDAGERLLTNIGPYYDGIESELAALSSFRDKPAGTVRITCSDAVIKTTLLPKLLPLLQEYPDIKLEFDVNYGFRDIVADRFDAGVRFGETLDKDMIAIPIGSDLRMAAVASPSYLARNPIPKTPHDLKNHRCINIRFPTYGGLYSWEFEKRGRKLNIRVDAQLIINSTPHIVDAAVGGLGIAYLPEIEFSPHIEEGRLIRVLKEWCPPFSGYHLYYPSRRQPSPAFALVVDALRMANRSASNHQ